MNEARFTRRDLLKGAGAALASGALPVSGLRAGGAQPAAAAPDAARERRMRWWHAAKFGMFIHWGLYSVHGRHEWAMEDEAIPILEYEAFARQFKPKPRAAREWARLAKAAGMKYMVMTTKHHEGFCHFTTSTTDYCSPKQGPGRDLVQEYVEAAREQGLRVGFYYSLMDWHHPDGARSEKDEAARQRFVPYIHQHVRELMSQYGKIDVLWYDVSWPLTKEGWESEKMNRMVFELQPEIIVNDRNGLQGDFSTPEQHISAEAGGRAWEACMTLNDSWGYQAADDNWKSAKTVIRNLISCARQGGNYLLNIGPMPDGSIPEESVRILREVGEWMQRNGEAIYRSGLTQPEDSDYSSFTRNGNILYQHVYFWPGTTVAVCGLQTKVMSVRLFASNREVRFQQDPYRLLLTGLPERAPDSPVTTIAIECESQPTQNSQFVRRQKPRAGVNITPA
ncbi:MAG: alpha-L-fucosidase [Acidobacteria bacterium]|nr:alpha-L-fucosidase [Acidobacteriota bacterium]